MRIYPLKADFGQADHSQRHSKFNVLSSPIHYKGCGQWTAQALRQETAQAPGACRKSPFPTVGAHCMRPLHAPIPRASSEKGRIQSAPTRHLFRQAPRAWDSTSTKAGCRRTVRVRKLSQSNTRELPSKQEALPDLISCQDYIYRL
jgi:hypothetical protein